MPIDLHTHSTASDGTDPPGALVEAAAAAGVQVLGITDHDTTGGWAEAAAARPPGLTLIRGAEFSTSVRYGSHQVSVHLLGYLFDPADPEVAAEQLRLREERLARGLGIVARMAAAGLPITAEQVLRIAGGAPVGRPHIGRALVDSGVLGSVDEAFASVLSSRGPYYLAKRDTDLLAAVRMISRAGGVSVIAHPRGRGESRVLTAEYLGVLAGAGLGGLEVDHPDHPPGARQELAELADRYGLLRTGSSDYHGHNKKLRLAQETTGLGQLHALVAASSGVTPPLGSIG